MERIGRLGYALAMSHNYRDRSGAGDDLRAMLDDHDTSGLRFSDIEQLAIKHDPRQSLTNNWRLAGHDELARIVHRLRGAD